MYCNFSFKTTDGQSVRLPVLEATENSKRVSDIVDMEGGENPSLEMIVNFEHDTMQAIVDGLFKKEFTPHDFMPSEK